MLQMASLALFASSLLCTSALADEASELTDLKTKVETLTQQVTSLTAELRDIEKERNLLRDELSKLKKGAEGSSNQKPVVAPIGTVWDGVRSSVNRTTKRVLKTEQLWTVVERDKKSIGFRSVEEFGVVWNIRGEFFDDKDFKIIDIKRVEATPDQKNIFPVGGITGNGTVVGNQLTVRMKWDDANANVEFKGALRDFTK